MQSPILEPTTFFQTPTDNASLSKKTVLLTRADLRGRGITFSNVHQISLEQRGFFPRRVTLSPAKVAWIEAEVDAWLDNRIASRPMPQEVHQ